MPKNTRLTIPLAQRPKLEMASIPSQMDEIGKYRIKAWTLHFWHIDCERASHSFNQKALEPLLLQRFRQQSEVLLKHGTNCRILAESLGVSYDHHNRLARTHWSKTLKAHMPERQIERAVYMLLNTTMPVKTIA